MQYKRILKMWLISIIISINFGCSSQTQKDSNSIFTDVPAIEDTQESKLPTSTFTPETIVNLDTPPTHAETNTPSIELEASQSAAETPIPSDNEEITGDIVTPLVSQDTTFPESIIKILRPGNLSRVTSPFSLVANVEPDARNQVEVELVGEDGRLMLYKIVEVVVLPGYTSGNLVTEMDFEIEGVAEAGRLSIYTRDEFGRIRSRSSVDLILLSNGLTKLNPYGDLRDNILIQQPISSGFIQGNTLFVTGLAKTNDFHPIEITLIDELGNIINVDQASLVDTENPEIKLFIGEVKYQVAEPTWVRLIAELPGERIPGIAHSTSVEIVIGP